MNEEVSMRQSVFIACRCSIELSTDSDFINKNVRKAIFFFDFVPTFSECAEMYYYQPEQIECRNAIISDRALHIKFRPQDDRQLHRHPHLDQNVSNERANEATDWKD